MKHTLRILLNIVRALIGGIMLIVLIYLTIQHIDRYRANKALREKQAQDEQTINNFLARRVDARGADGDTTDPFGDDAEVRILLIGLDKRVGQTQGHCDAIQMIDINKKTNHITITAVPRGTYAPLPPGVAATSTDYYVSNSCGLVSLEYGVNQIEKIVGQKADYIVTVGFSETLGILRSLKLPTEETLAWLRHRQGYAIGEPQRARNHSTFIKQSLNKYVPEEKSALDTPFHYLIYTMIQTDLSFNQLEQIVDTLTDMEIHDHPEKITLAMRPHYDVQDIAYDPEHVGEYIQKMVEPIKHLISSAINDKSAEQVQAEIIAKINDNIDDDKFITWAYDNDLWLQIDDDDAREHVRWDIFTRYIYIQDKETRTALLADYVLEMQQLEKDAWYLKGKELLDKEVNE